MTAELQSTSTGMVAGESRDHLAPGVDPAAHLETAEAFITATELRIGLTAALSDGELRVLRGALSMAGSLLDVAGASDFWEQCQGRFDAASDRIGRALSHLAPAEAA